MEPLIAGIQMGGYACYVWPAYGVVAAVLLANHFSLRWQRARTHQVLKQCYKRSGV